MKWRLSRWAAKTSAKTFWLRRPAWHLPRALVGSLAVHAALVLLFFSNKALRPAPVASPIDAVEIAIAVQGIEVPGTVDAIPAAVEAPTTPSAPAAQAPASRSAVARRDAIGSAPVAAESPAQASIGQASAAPSNAAVPSSAEVSASATADRFATFKPAHPNLYGPVRLPAPEQGPRDLLAAPTMKRGAPPSEQSKARIIQGPGDVSASVAEDGAIQFHTPGVIRPNKLPIHAFSDGLDNGGGQPPDPDRIAKRRSPVLATGEGLRLGISGRLDVTEMVMKLAGQDPHAAAKKALAEQTREERQCMAVRVRGERLKEALSTLADKVRHLAARVDLSAAQRRRLVFDMWDECSEEANSTDYGAMARATVLAIAREAFPSGSDKAYPTSELLAFNERRSSRQRFAPYEPSPSTHARQPDGGLPAE